MTQRFPSFGFPTTGTGGGLPPSIAASRIWTMGTLAAVIAGILAGSMLANVLLGVALIKKADVLPFVADGGVAGCAATVIPEIER